MVDRSSAPHRQPNRSARSCTCGGSSGWDRSRSVTGSACRPQPCTRSWSGAGSNDSRMWETATEVLRNAVAWFAVRGVTVQRVLSDNGSCYKSNLWRDTCAELGIIPKKTRVYRPQTNGKIERFHRTLVEGWAFKKFYNSESARLAALPAWVHQYTHHRPHSAIGKAAPITKLDNLAEHHT